jgi:hypothetical protein
MAVLVHKHFHELLEPDLDIVHQCSSGITEFLVIWVENVGSNDGSQVDDDLLVGWHETLRQGTEHLIGVKLLVQLSLENSVITILWEERIMIIILGEILREREAGEAPAEDAQDLSE